MGLYIERFVNYADKLNVIEQDVIGNVVIDGSQDGISNRKHYEYLFKHTLDIKTINFTNSWKKLNLLRSLARDCNKDVCRVHHSNMSALLPEITKTK